MGPKHVLFVTSGLSGTGITIFTSPVCRVPGILLSRASTVPPA